MDTVIVKQPTADSLRIDQVQQGERVVRQLNDEDWRQFVDQHPQGNIFHTPEMFQVFARATGFHPTLWAAVRGDAQIEALFLPVQVTLNELLRPLTTRAIAYGSVLSAPSDEGHRALALLLKSYVRENRRRCLFTELRNVSSLENEQGVLQEQGFAYEDHLNYLIDLGRPAEEIFLGIGARTRKNIRHALNRGKVAVVEATKPDQIDTCYNLLSQTYRAARVPLADRSIFDAAFALLHPKGMIRFTLAYVEDAPAAVSIDLLYKDVIYGWYGGMDRTYSRFVPNELLMWHLLKWGSENGFSLYDFGGAGKPDEEYGVRDFKAKFGGRLVCFGRNTHVHLPGVLWLSKQGYQVMRHLFNGRFLGL
jgi:serine/alanine adding enzyme